MCGWIAIRFVVVLMGRCSSWILWLMLPLQWFGLSVIWWSNHEGTKMSFALLLAWLGFNTSNWIIHIVLWNVKFLQWLLSLLHVVPCLANLICRVRRWFAIFPLGHRLEHSYIFWISSSCAALICVHPDCHIDMASLICRLRSYWFNFYGNFIVLSFQVVILNP